MIFCCWVKPLRVSNKRGKSQSVISVAAVGWTACVLFRSVYSTLMVIAVLWRQHTWLLCISCWKEGDVTMWSLLPQCGQECELLPVITADSLKNFFVTVYKSFNGGSCRANGTSGCSLLSSPATLWPCTTCQESSPWCGMERRPGPLTCGRQWWRPWLPFDGQVSLAPPRQSHQEHLQ